MSVTWQNVLWFNNRLVFAYYEGQINSITVHSIEVESLASKGNLFWTRILVNYNLFKFIIKFLSWGLWVWFWWNCNSNTSNKLLNKPVCSLYSPIFQKSTLNIIQFNHFKSLMLNSKRKKKFPKDTSHSLFPFYVCWLKIKQINIYLVKIIFQYQSFYFCSIFMMINLQ